MPARHRSAFFAAAAIFAFVSQSGAAQQPAAAQPPGPGVGAIAPDFTLPGATRYGLLQTPVRLSDYRGSTVVLAFFFQARTKG